MLQIAAIAAEQYAATKGFSVRFGPTNLLLVAIVFLELAVISVYRLERCVARDRGRHRDAGRIGGSMFSGFVALARSRYLLGVAVWVSLLSFGGTILYLEQANIVAASVHGAAAQTRLFASIDLAVGLLTLATQVLATGQLLKRFGTGASAGALPAVYIIGFTVLALAPSLAVVFVFQVARRWMNFAIANPARQVFFTVVGRDEKYKAKNMIDVVVFRGSDALYAPLFDALQALGLKIGGIALCALPVAIGWLALSMRLGRKQERLAIEVGTAAAQAE